MAEIMCRICVQSSIITLKLFSDIYVSPEHVIKVDFSGYNSGLDGISSSFKFRTSFIISAFYRKQRRGSFVFLSDTSPWHTGSSICGFQETIIITIIRLGGFIFLRVNLPVKISFIITPSSFIISHIVFLLLPCTVPAI